MRHHSNIAKTHMFADVRLLLMAVMRAGPHKASFWLRSLIVWSPSGPQKEENTVNFYVFGASQAKNHGIVTLVVVVVVVVVVAGGGGGGCCWCWCLCYYPCIFCLSLVVTENRQIRCVFAFFCKSRDKRYCIFFYFLHLRNPKPLYLRWFLVLVTETTVFTLFSQQHRTNTLVCTQFSARCKKWFSYAKSRKNPCKT